MSSRAVSCRSDAGLSDYERALKQAQTAIRLTPYQTSYQVTLGMAQYRLGQYAKSIDTLGRAELLDSTSEERFGPEKLAFLAMAQYRDGRKDEALATLNRLRDRSQKALPQGDEAATACRLEAEQLIAHGPSPNP